MVFKTRVVKYFLLNLINVKVNIFCRAIRERFTTRNECSESPVSLGVTTQDTFFQVRLIKYLFLL